MRIRSLRGAICTLGFAATNAAWGQGAPNPAVLTADSLFRAARYDQALAAYETLAASQPAHPGFWVRIGLSAANLKRYERARDAFARAAAIDSSPVSMYNTGAMLARLNQADSAFAWVARAVERGFSDANVFRNDEDFAALRGHEKFAVLLARLESPCVSDERSRRFDFWIGEWEVRNADGVFTGRNTIERVSGGCALLENWTDGQGKTGKSLNAFNRSTGQWQQFWAGQGGDVNEYRESRWDGSSLVFTARPGGNALLRLTFTPIDQNHVRQFSEVSLDNGTSWKPQYDLHYYRASR
jgi:tetratricopeptide (TPR) repeat protein